MMVGRIDGATRLLGKSQGFFVLPVRDEVIDERVVGPTPSMVTAWEPTPEELAALNKGARVHVRLLGDMHPPIMVDVGPVPGESA